MHLQTDAMDAVFARELRGFLPVRDDFFFPLPVKHLAVFGRPAIRDPVWLRVRRSAARAAGKANDHFHLKPFSEQYSLAKDFAVARRMLFVRMHGVTVTAQRGNTDSAILKLFLPRLGFSRISKEFIYRTVSL